MTDTERPIRSYAPEAVAKRLGIPVDQLITRWDRELEHAPDPDDNPEAARRIARVLFNTPDSSPRPGSDT